MTLFFLATSCSDGKTAGPTTTLVPIEGQPGYPTTVRTTTTLPPTTTTTRLGFRAKDSADFTDAQLQDIALKIVQVHMDGYGSNDAAKVDAARAVTIEPRLVQLEKKQTDMATRNAVEKGAYEVIRVIRSRRSDEWTFQVFMCTRDQKVTTDVASGAVVDPLPTPRPIHLTNAILKAAVSERNAVETGCNWATRRVGAGRQMRLVIGICLITAVLTGWPSQVGAASDETIEQVGHLWPDDAVQVVA